MPEPYIQTFQAHIMIAGYLTVLFDRKYTQ